MVIVTVNDDLLDFIHDSLENTIFDYPILSEKILSYLIRTDDGSYTINSNSVDSNSETMHTNKGAISESFEKFLNPINLDFNKDLHVLDLCSGLGYNAAALIDSFSKSDGAGELYLDLVEISLETIIAGLLVPSPIMAHGIIKKAISIKLLEEGLLSEPIIHEDILDIPDNININIYLDDARRIIKNLSEDYYDIIFLDSFSPKLVPELYSLHLVSEFKRVIKTDGVIITYTSSAPYISALVFNGFFIGESPAFGRKSGGTLASLNSDNICSDISSNDERMIALSDAGIPFLDEYLDSNSEEIKSRRTNMRKNARGTIKISSAVKTPTYIGKDIDKENLKRRVLRNLNKIGLDNLKSKKAIYLIEPQTDKKYKNSRDRILEMEKRLNKHIKKINNEKIN